MKTYTVYTQPMTRYQDKGWQGSSRIQFDYIDAAILYNGCKTDNRVAMKIVNNETRDIIYSNI